MLDYYCLCLLLVSLHIVPIFASCISSHAHSWHHSNVYIAFMHCSEWNVVERACCAHRCCWTRARCWVLCRVRENQAKQLSMIPCAYSIWFNLVISFGYLWVMHIMLFIAFLYILLCITLPLYCYPYSCHLLVNLRTVRGWSRFWAFYRATTYPN